MLKPNSEVGCAAAAAVEVLRHVRNGTTRSRRRRMRGTRASWRRCSWPRMTAAGRRTQPRRRPPMLRSRPGDSSTRRREIRPHPVDELVLPAVVRSRECRAVRIDQTSFDASRAKLYPEDRSTRCDDVGSRFRPDPLSPAGPESESRRSRSVNTRTSQGPSSMLSPTEKS